MRRRGEDQADAQELAELAALADGSLASERRVALEAQVAESAELADRLAEQQRAITLTQNAAAEVDAPAGLRRRVDARRSRRRVWTPARLVPVAAAAAAVLAVAIGLAALRSGSSEERLYAALAGTGASGQATLTKTDSGWRIELDAAGLPRLEGGRFYEAWLRNANGVLVPIGTFNEGQNVTLWAGVSPKTFSTLTVTREQANDDQASSGERVLVGTVTTSR
jgi:anti-sigma-K factor RskA